jgi:GT2 family glycosyltransferase
MKVSITIATRNRCEELRRTCAEIALLEPAPDQVIICLDGCNDGSEAMVREEHPGFERIVHEHAVGSVGSRDEMIRAASGDVILSLDDDSYPIERDAIARIRAMFRDNPRLAIAAFPQRSDEFPETLSRTRWPDAHPIGTFANSGAAIRRNVFLEVGGYPAWFQHAYEEPDLALRCIAAGYEVRWDPEVTVRHHWTASQRNEIRIHQRHARNEFWSVLLRCPMPQLAAVALFRVGRQAAYAWKRGLPWLVREPCWWWEAITGVPRCFANRSPVHWPVYLRWMQLVRKSSAVQTE